MSDLRSRCARSRTWLLAAVATIAVGAFAVAGCSSESPQLPAAPAVAGGAPQPPALNAPPPPGSFVPNVPVTGGPPAPGSVGPPAPGRSTPSAPAPNAPSNAVGAPGIVPGHAATVPGAPLTPGGIPALGGTAPLAAGARSLSGGLPPTNEPLAIKAPERYLLAPDLKAGPTKIEFPAGSSVIRSLQPSKFIAIGGFTGAPRVGAQIWDLTKMSVAHEFHSPLLPYAHQFALSQGGTYIAGTSLSRENNKVQVHVFNCSTQESLHVFEPFPGAGLLSPRVFCFAGPNRLLMTLNRIRFQSVRVWDVLSERFVSEFDLPNVSVRSSEAVSPDGKYFAQFGEYGAERAVRVYDLETGRRVAEDILPSHASDGLNVEALQFSPDGKEIVALSRSLDIIKLIGWSTETREVTIDLSFDHNELVWQFFLSRSGADRLQFLGADGWLLFGSMVVDRISGRLVWHVGVAEGGRVLDECLALDPNRVLYGVLNRDFSTRIEAVPLPWDRIQKALAESNSEEPVFLKPGQAVSLEIRASAGRFATPEDAIVGLTTVLTERLAQDGIRVEDGQATVLDVQYREEEGETLKKFVGQPGGGSLGPGRGGNHVATGRKIQATRATCNMAFKVKGESKPFWKNTVKFDPTKLTLRGDQEATDDAARESTFNMLKILLVQNPTPFFVSKNPDVPMLPGLTEIKAANK